MINLERIEEDNSLISKFMGRSHVLNYHESWNLLMPVIYKLTEKRFRAVLYLNPDASSSVIYDPSYHQSEIAIHGERGALLMITWESVVKFIKTNSLAKELNA